MTPTSDAVVESHLHHAHSILACMPKSAAALLLDCVSALLDYHDLVRELGYASPHKGIPRCLGDALRLREDRGALQRLVNAWVRATLVAHREQALERRRKQSSAIGSESSASHLKIPFDAVKRLYSFKQADPAEDEDNDSIDGTLLDEEENERLFK